MSDEKRDDLHIEVDAKIIINCASGSKVKLLLSQNLQGELDFITRHFSISRESKVETEIKKRLEKIVEEYINVKKNNIIKIELMRKNKHNINHFIMDCFITVENDRSNSDKREKFMTTDEITKSSSRKSLAVLNTLVYFTENKSS